MKKLIGTFLFLLCGMYAGAWGQTFDLVNDQLFEPTIGSQAISNARAVALGGAITASVQDGSALWYNPAALARIPRIELSGDLLHDRIAGESLPLTLDPLAQPPTVSAREEKLRRTRLGSAYITIPVPTYRGALTVAGGVTVSNNLDRILAGTFRFDPGTFVDTLQSTVDTLIAEEIADYSFNEDQRGLIRAWQVGFGFDISPRVSVGLTGVYYAGNMEFTNRTTFEGSRIEGNIAFDTLPVRWDFVAANTEEISGWGAHGGILYRPRNNVAIGALVRAPVKLSIDLDQFYSEQRDQGSIFEGEALTTRKLQLPFSVAAGVAWLHRNFLFAGDFAYTDWSQSEYKDSPLISQFNDELSRTYREEVTVAGGVEWIIPSASTTLRAGVRWGHLPYREDLVLENRLAVSGGVGFLIDQVMAVDLAVTHETLRGGNPVFGFDERYTRTRALVTTAYRL